MKKYVVYKHTCPNQKCYIGITYDVIQRWQNGQGYRNQPKFYKDICKYGWQNIRHEILEQDLALKEAQEKEIEYIKLFDTISNGYNIHPGGDLLGRSIVYCFDKNGVLVDEFYGTRVAAKAVGGTKKGSGISSAIKKHTMYKGYYWSHEPVLPESIVKKNNNNTAITMIQKNTNKILTFVSLKQAADYFGVKTNALYDYFSRVIYQPHCKLYNIFRNYTVIVNPNSRYSYSRHKKAVIGVSIDGKVIKKYNSVYAAASQFKNSKSAQVAICNCLNKKQKTAKGFIWKYADQYFIFTKGFFFKRSPFLVYQIRFFKHM